MARTEAAKLGTALNELNALTTDSLIMARKTLQEVLPTAEIVMPSAWESRREQEITKMILIPYGSYLYSRHPSDLNAYCILPVNQESFKAACAKQTYPFEKKHEYFTKEGYQQNVTLLVDGLEVDLHLVPFDNMFLNTIITPATNLHLYVVAEMENRATISVHYDALKKWCRQQEIYSSRYGLMRGILLALLAVQWRDKANYDLERKTFVPAHEEVILQFLRGEEVDKTSPYKTREGKIMDTPGLYPVVEIETKRRIGLQKYLEKSESFELLTSKFDYDDVVNARKLMRNMEEDHTISYFIPLRAEDSKLAFFTDTQQLPHEDF